MSFHLTATRPAPGVAPLADAPPEPCEDCGYDGPADLEVVGPRGEERVLWTCPNGHDNDQHVGDVTFGSSL